MSATNLDQVGGYTPVIDELVGRYGIMAAAVFGRVWRYCQMGKGICDASQDRIAADLYTTRKTVNPLLTLLVKEGYLKDLDEGIKNRPHRYADTGKANVKGITKGDTLEDAGVTVGDTGVTESNTGCNETTHQGVTKGDMKIEVKKELREELRQKEEEAESPAQPNAPANPATKPAAAAFGYVITEEQAQAIYQNVTGMMTFPSSLRAEGIRMICDIANHKGDMTADYLRPFYKAYVACYRDDGRPYQKTGGGWLEWAGCGENGEIPTRNLAQLDELTLGQMGPGWFELAEAAKQVKPPGSNGRANGHATPDDVDRIFAELEAKQQQRR